MIAYDAKSNTSVKSQPAIKLNVTYTSSCCSVKLQSANKLYIIEHKIDDIRYIGKIANSS